MRILYIIISNIPSFFKTEESKRERDINKTLIITRVVDINKDIFTFPLLTLFVQKGEIICTSFFIECFSIFR